VAPIVTVGMPVYNRQDVLRRALRSIESQTLEDFLCLVVDDASTVPIKPVVDEFDSRFRYVRNDQNRGCTGARYTAFDQMDGEFLMGLDSDNEFFPWTLERATRRLSERDDVDGVIGMSLFEGKQRVTVADDELLVTPDYYASRSWPVWDCHAIVRRGVVEEWATKRRDYYNCDFHFWLTFHLAHNSLFLDEPWGRHHVSGSDRITYSPDPRRFRDPVVFVDEHQPILGDTRCRPLDDWLKNMWFFLRRNRRKGEADVVRGWMNQRRVSTHGVTASRARRKVLDLLGDVVLDKSGQPDVL